VDFRAKLTPLSPAGRMWRTNGTNGGMVCGAHFARQGNGEFVTGVLTAEQVVALRDVAGVEMMAVTTPVPAHVRIVEEPPAPPEPPQRPVMRQPAKHVPPPPPVRRNTRRG